MISNEQIAHDLAIAYVINRHGAEVVGKFSVTGDAESTNAVVPVKQSGYLM